ncbi:MAG: serine/threonine-protein kinase [Polyangiaceae bacterium]|nr:serine/threonine-protein kinase [Polyangiaceae bacterium]
MQCPSCHAAVDDNRPFCSACGAALPHEGPPDPLIGRTLAGKYKIVKLLGEGGMGAVYVGEQPLGHTIRRIAIKTLHPHLSNDPQIRERFYREVGTLAGLEHPNTVQVFDFGATEDGVLFIVMEFVQGESIAEVLTKSGALAPVRTEKILAQICGSLGEAHSKGIIHRDLKPDNVILTERAGQKDFVKVLDFGIAKRSGEEDRREAKLTQQGTVLGTPPYMSPEQFTGEPLDWRSDVYSLGVMAYEMLTGELPFDAKTPWEWATLHMTATPRPMETTPRGAALPEPMRGAIMRALAKNREQRFASVQAFLDCFCGVAGSGQVAAPQRTPTAIDPSVPAAPSPYGVRMGNTDSLKGQTQIGEPMVPTPAGFAGAGGMAYGAPASPRMAPVSVTPSPYGMQGMPYALSPTVGSRKKGRGLLLGLVAVVGVASIIAVVVGIGSNRTELVEFDAAVVPTSTATVIATASSTTPVHVPPPEIPTLNVPGNTPKPVPPPAPKPTPSSPPEPGPTLPPFVLPVPTPSPEPNPPPPQPNPPAPTPPPYMPPSPTPAPTPTPRVSQMPPAAAAVCAQARTARQSGRPNLTLDRQCRAAGGNPY